MKKITIIMIICIMCQILSICFNNTYAANSLQDAFDGAKNFVTQGEKESENTIDNSKLKIASDTVYNILLTIAFIVAIVCGIIIGIQFMVGSIENKADIKEALLPYVIGCIVVFGAFGIWKIAVNIGLKF